MTYFILGKVSHQDDSGSKLLGTPRTEKGLRKKMVSIMSQSGAPKNIFVVEGKVILRAKTRRCAGKS